MRAAFLIAVLLVGPLGGCVDRDTPGNGDGGAAAPAAIFQVPDIRIGDVYRYAFTFKGPTFEASGITDVQILERAPVADGRGVLRDAVHVRQSSPDGSFQEQYWIDASTLTQFKIENRANYSEVSRFPIEPLRPIPVRHASYGNGTGTRERFHEDPVFEDYSFFGGFASGRTIPPLGASFDIPGNFWMRDTPQLLGSHSNISGKVDREGLDETWGPTRHVAFKIDWRDGDSFETIEWDGTFSPQVPLTLECKRIIKAKLGTRVVDVGFNITLLAFQPGEGEALVRGPPAAPPARRDVEFASWTRAPADGTGPRLLFPLSEALTALEKDPTAMKYFQDHPRAYLYVAHLGETDTCAFSQPYPGCHWFEWSGRFVAPDDWQLDFRVEKYVDNTGTGVAVTPLVSRDYPFEVLFSAGSVPPPPEPAVVAAKGSIDWPERTAYPAESMTLAGAIQAFKQTAWANLTSLDPNVAVVFLRDEGYGFYLSKEDWVFPSQNPELVFFYDEGPLVLERHTAHITPEGHVLESRNFFHQVAQR